MVEQTGTPERKTRSRHRKVKLLEAEICKGREPETEQGGAGMERKRVGTLPVGMAKSKPPEPDTHLQPHVPLGHGLHE
ncbi:hypothetical protein N7471_000886 [Penicillium samsonianum]|uniref:uncharacterized protein n=1 Tax=Penicillium samsonianum TaxID=1882272 RepID=UPI002548966C|nr:uncharacterized protein N7471_000886 [Penicillium samsonianum]KAJ6149687.1 hypothetical protein N7471_000886 [Penicillium samsonianum]